MIDFIKRLFITENKLYKKKDVIKKLKGLYPEWKTIAKDYDALMKFKPLIRKESNLVRPLTYQEPKDFEHLSRVVHWMHEENSMEQDVVDFNTKLLDIERNSISNILKGFAQSETFVGDYWSEFITYIFPLYEIKLMAINFADREGIHAEAYNSLIDQLALKLSYIEFTQEKGIIEKLETLTSISNFKNPKDIDNLEVCAKMGMFAALEGACLMSSFSVLLSFKHRANNKEQLEKLPSGIEPVRLKGIATQMEWSVRDELLHAKAAAWLFRRLCQECASVKLKEFAMPFVKEGMELIFKTEIDYLDKIFEFGDLPTIKKEEVRNYVVHRFEEIWKDLGYETKLLENEIVDTILLKEMEWFENVAMLNNRHIDFFSQKNTDYSAAVNFKGQTFKPGTISAIFSEEKLKNMKSKSTNWDKINNLAHFYKDKK